MTCKVQTTDPFGTRLDVRLRAFEAKVESARQAGAAAANRASRNSLVRTRPIAPPRPGRNHESIERVLNWRPITVNGKQGSAVGVNQSELNSRAPHWIIQEIGTGQRAVARVAGRRRATGRPTKGDSAIRTVKSQKGRRISSGLVFADGPGGQFSPPGSASGQQLYLRKQIQGVPFATRRDRSQAGIIIRREIEGQHFVRDGAREGFRVYRRSVLAAARSQFRKPKP